MQLYNLVGKYKELLEVAQNEDNLEVVLDTLESLEDAIEDKVENIAHVLNQMKSDTNILDAEIKRLQAKKKTLTNNYNYLREYLLYELVESGLEKVKTPLFNITIRNNPEKVVIRNEEQIPMDYKVPEYKIDKKALKEALKQGKEVKGAKLVQEKGLLIK